MRIRTATLRRIQRPRTGKLRAVLVSPVVWIFSSDYAQRSSGIRHLGSRNSGSPVTTFSFCSRIPLEQSSPIGTACELRPERKYPSKDDRFVDLVSHTCRSCPTRRPYKRSVCRAKEVASLRRRPLVPFRIYRRDGWYRDFRPIIYHVDRVLSPLPLICVVVTGCPTPTF